MNTSNAIQHLIDRCIDDERALRLESQFVNSIERRNLLQRLSAERHRFVQQLEVLDNSRRHAVRATISWRELLRELRGGVRHAMRGRNDADAIADCRHARSTIENLYAEALSLPWGNEKVLPVLRGHYERVVAERQLLNAVQF